MNGNKQIKIAIVDDHPLLLITTNEILTLWQYAVTVQANNGRDFLEKISADNMPDICIVDLNMPEMSGQEVIKALKEKWPTVKTIIYTMGLEGIDKTLLGADAIVSKTSCPSELRERIEHLSLQTQS